MTTLDQPPPAAKPVAPGVLQKALPLGWDRDTIDRFAENAAANLGYKPGASIEKIVHALGGKILFEDLESACQAGAIEVMGRQNFRINVSPFAAGNRARFTIAHELGHYILHSQMGKVPIVVRRDDNGRLEWEANWFAACFLMPKTIFEERVKENHTLAELATSFDVPESVVQIRKKAL